MLKVKDYYNLMNNWAPFDTEVEYDNVGMLVGNMEDEVTGVIIALDITKEVIEEAKEEGANLIISHHPIIFRGLNEVSFSTASGMLSYELARNSMNAICAHTNLDIAQGGVSDCMAEILELKKVECCQENVFLRMGELEKEMDIQEFASLVKEKMSADCIQIAGIPPKSIKKVAVAGGSACSEYIYAKNMGADILLSGEAKHSEGLAVQTIGFCIMKAGHYHTEATVLPKILSYLQKCTSGVQSIGRIRITCAKTSPFKVM